MGDSDLDNYQEDTPIFEYSNPDQKIASVVLHNINESYKHFKKTYSDLSNFITDQVQEYLPEVYNFLKSVYDHSTVPFEMISLLVNGVHGNHRYLQVSEAWQGEKLSKNESEPAINFKKALLDFESFELEDHVEKKNNFDESDKGSVAKTEENDQNNSQDQESVVEPEETTSFEPSNSTKLQSSLKKSLKISDLANLKFDDSEIFLINYQLIHQICSPLFTGFTANEYFYHKLTFFDRKNNIIHMVSFSVEDEQSVEIIKDYEDKYSEQLFGHYYVANNYSRES